MWGKFFGIRIDLSLGLYIDYVISKLNSRIIACLKGRQYFFFPLEAVIIQFFTKTNIC